MTYAPHWIATATLALAATAVLAQTPAAPAAAGSAAAPAASAAAGPGPGMGRMGGGMGGMGGMGGGQGPRAAAQAGSDFTPGWALMSREERLEHRNRMRSMKTQEECRAYLAQHHEKMAARAQEKGVPMRGPRRDACGALPK